MSENLSINVLGVELNTSKISKKGIKLSKLDPAVKSKLEVFDTEDRKGNKGPDGYLSANEVRKIVNIFAKYDINPKDNTIDNTEATNLEEEFKNLYESSGKEFPYSENENFSDNVKDFAQNLSEAMKQKKGSTFLMGFLNVISDLDISF